MATTAAVGAYVLTLHATDRTNSASSSLTLAVNAAAPAADPLAWSSTGPIISAIPNATHPIVSVKDPTVVYFKNQWNVYATTADTSGNWNMVYLNFANWNQASAAQPYYMDATPGLSGYHCAPELFYFTPQDKWYLIYQSGPPQYSTAADPTQPQTWTPPQSFFPNQPSLVKNWLDFWAICDSANCYLFFTDDGGDFYRSQTTIANFPNGFSTPEIIMQAPTAGDLFEASRTYSIKGSTQYLTIVEAMGGPRGHRYFRAFLANSLDGLWTPVSGANSFDTPFLGGDNVTFAAGVTPWTDDFSHGEIVRDNYDETLQIDLDNLQFLYQGDNPAANAASYSQIPWQLALATAMRFPGGSTKVQSSANPNPTSGIAPGSLASFYGTDLATSTPGSTSLPLPTTYVGTMVAIDDSSGTTADAPLLYVATGQINFEVPSSVATGPATVTAFSGDGTRTTVNTTIATVAPGVFALNAAGLVAADVVLYSGSTQTAEKVYSASGSTIAANPVNIGGPSDQAFLEIFGTGFQAAGKSGVQVTIGGLDATVHYVGPQGQYAGLDQVNVQIPPALAGKGNVTIQLTANGIAANPVDITIQ